MKGLKSIRKVIIQWPVFLIAILILGCVGSYWIFIDTFEASEISGDPAHWGTFGDYIGGVSGTIFSMISVVLLYLTLEGQARYATIQQFEPSFFNLISNQREIRKSLSGYVYEDLGNGDGRDYYDLKGDSYIEAVACELETKMRFVDGNVDGAVIEKIYELVYEDKAGELGHYFRHLYHIVKLHA